ncbi:ABC transporter permease [Alicyclobacillus sp. SO9]|uniref:ABC transporter permease n=1 Tax=Alicyclobacillus sp. SO9 TaxID=2665646 RepID=UPI0018E89402|nr:ABC transporter permease [Alicyclobacillus sp. SO9]QQE76952.1 ABC transporter permease [Alicyclobacillus sp. SO9]
MMQFRIVWSKEVVESWKNRKWIWLPLVFVLLGAMQPISTYFMPQILKMSGGLPAGTVIHIPTPSAGGVFAKAQSQYNSLGLLVLVLAFMGSISNERREGVLDLVLVKPVSHTAYILAKWFSAVVLTITALTLGDIAAWYYTVQLIGPLSIPYAMLSLLLYAFWLILIVTLTTFFSVLMTSTVANAFVTLSSAAVLSVVAAVLKWKWSPGALPSHASAILSIWDKGSTNALQSNFQIVWSVVVTGIVVVLLLVASVYEFRRKTFL